MRRLLLPAFLLCAVSASAGNNRSAVSVGGLDTNPCTPASPCRSFVAAIAATNPGGEIVALDSAGYGPFSIPIPVTVSGAPGVHAAITATSGDAIQVAAGATDRVSIRNLVLIGAGAPRGIYHFNGAALDVVHCLIRGYPTGILVESDGAVDVTIDDTTLLDCQGGINMYGDYSGVNAIHATITNSLIQGGSQGLTANYSTKVLVSHCTIASNITGASSIANTGGPALTADLTIEDSVIAHNIHGTVVSAVAPAIAKLTLSANVIAYCASEGVYQIDAVAYTFGNNVFASNLSDSPIAMTPVSLK